MILILDSADIDTWLRGAYDDIVSLQDPNAPVKMTVRGAVFPSRSKERWQPSILGKQTQRRRAIHCVRYALYDRNRESRR